jgi:hypothetical protein
MKFLVAVILFAVIALGSVVNSPAKEYAPTPAQKHFTAIVKGLPGVVSAEWESPISLWVKASAKAVGSPPKPDKAKTLADILVERGRTALRQPFCVHIYQKKESELARSCAYY